MGAKKIEGSAPMLIEDVMKYAACSERHVREELKKKKLIGHKPGKRWIFYIEDVEKWIKRK